MSDSKDREEFEAFCKDYFVCTKHSFNETHGEGYYQTISSDTFQGRKPARYSDVWMLFKTWKAARAIDRAEIERLKNELAQKDEEIAKLHKTLAQKSIDSIKLAKVHGTGFATATSHLAALRQQDMLDLQATIEKQKEEIASLKARIELLEHDMKSGDYEHLYAVVLQELAEAQRVPYGWQPIETAPKDCSILIYDGESVMEASWWGGYYGDPNKPGWMPANLDEEYGQYVEATHWMPLPPAPTYKKE
jgi:hypothetical protein